MGQTRVDSQRIAAVVEEFRRLQAGEGLRPMGSVPCEVGAVIYHGDGTKPDATWAATLVRQPGSVAAPIVAGTADAVRAAVEALLPALARPGPAVCDPPVAIVRGLPRMFVAMGGRHLVGVIDTDGRLFALLATDGLGFFVLVHDGARAEVVRAGAPEDLRELDLDPVLRLPLRERQTPLLQAS